MASRTLEMEGTRAMAERRLLMTTMMTLRKLTLSQASAWALQVVIWVAALQPKSADQGNALAASHIQQTTLHCADSSIQRSGYGHRDLIAPHRGHTDPVLWTQARNHGQSRTKAITHGKKTERSRGAYSATTRKQSRCRHGKGWTTLF